MARERVRGSSLWMTTFQPASSGMSDALPVTARDDVSLFWQDPKTTPYSLRLLKKVQMQGGARWAE